MAVSSRTLALGTAGIVAGLVAIVTVRAVRDGAVSEPSAAASAYKPAPPPAPKPTGVGSTPTPSIATSAPPAPSSRLRFDLDGGTQSYADELVEHPGGQTFGPKLRPVDLEIFDFIASGKAKAGMSDDVFPKKPYRVKMMRVGQNGMVVKVWIDLNRNGKWDEYWDLKPDQVDRRLAPDDDENYDTYARLRNGHWLFY